MGLYDLLITNKQFVDHSYAIYLEQMRNIYCAKMPQNYILEYPDKIDQSYLKIPSVLDTKPVSPKPLMQHQNSIQRNRPFIRHSPFRKYTRSHKFIPKKQKIIHDRKIYSNIIREKNKP